MNEALDIWADVNTLRADKNLYREIEGVEEVLVTVFYAFTFGFGHEVEVDGLTSDNGAERAVFHDDETITEFREHECGLSRKWVFDNLWGSWGNGRL